jgi:hypothetical protein
MTCNGGLGDGVLVAALRLTRVPSTAVEGSAGIVKSREREGSRTRWPAITIYLPAARHQEEENAQLSAAASPACLAGSLASPNRCLTAPPIHPPLTLHPHSLHSLARPRLCQAGQREIGGRRGRIYIFWPFPARHPHRQPGESAAPGVQSGAYSFIVRYGAVRYSAFQPRH